MRHASKIGEDRLAADILAERQGEIEGRVFKGLRSDQLAKVNCFPPGIRQLDTDDVAARNDCDTAGHRTHRAGDIVGKADDA